MNTDFEGHTEVKKHRHRTVGPHRAWCECGVWCWPETPCFCCGEHIYEWLHAELVERLAEAERLLSVFREQKEQLARDYLSESERLIEAERLCAELTASLSEKLGEAKRQRDVLRNFVEGHHEGALDPPLRCVEGCPACVALREAGLDE